MLLKPVAITDQQKKHILTAAARGSWCTQRNKSSATVSKHVWLTEKNGALEIETSAKEFVLKMIDRIPQMCSSGSSGCQSRVDCLGDSTGRWPLYLSTKLKHPKPHHEPVALSTNNDSYINQPWPYGPMAPTNTSCRHSPRHPNQNPRQRTPNTWRLVEVATVLSRRFSIYTKMSILQIY